MMNKIASRKNLETYIKGLCSGRYTLQQCAVSCHKSVRTISRIKKRYLEEGMSAFTHRATGRASNRRISESVRERIAMLYAGMKEPVNFLFFTEILKSDYDINISYSSVKNILKEKKFKSPESHRTKKTAKVHRPRPRRKNEGDLLQIDGTPYQWFKQFGDNTYYCMHGAIDDATGKITALYMTENECLYGYMELLRLTIKKCGRPREIYSDRAAIFCTSPKRKDQLSIEEQLAGLHEKHTQWQRILEELNINQILAWTPQAKGRVERMWSTLQGRLPTIFYRKKISTIETANIFLQKYVDEFNSQFGKKPADDDSFYLPLDESMNLDDILCVQYQRKTNHAGVFSFHKFLFQVKDCKYVAEKKFMLCITRNGVFAKMDDGLFYRTEIIKIPDDYDESLKIGDCLKTIIESYLYRYAKEVSC